tara:strand:+ start:212 stop:394 length:183 start_codon:yes stop_codon:yes gene_type:complete
MSIERRDEYIERDGRGKRYLWHAGWLGSAYTVPSMSKRSTESRFISKDDIVDLSAIASSL